MKKFTSILLAFMLVFQTFNQLYFVVYYEVNKKFIAEVLCINKDKPEMHCNGQCYLAQKLKESSSKTDKADDKVVINVSRLEFILTYRPLLEAIDWSATCSTPVSQHLHPVEIPSRQLRPPIPV